jgi:hypothetical protein
MGIEPTQNGTSALLTVLKTAEPTRTLPPPAGRFSYQIHNNYHTVFYGIMEGSSAACPVKKIFIPVRIDSHFILNASDISLWAVNPQ